MTAGPISVVAVGLACATVIYRWRSFVSPWDFALSWSLLLMAIALPLLRVPGVTPAVNRGLHTLTGRWQLNVWLGHCVYIAAFVALLYYLLTRLDGVDELHRRFRWHIAPVVSITPPVSLALIWMSPAVASSGAVSIVQVPIDGWLLAYWRLMCATLIYLLAYCGWALATIFIHDRRSRLVASLQFVAIVLGGIGTVPMDPAIDPIIRSAATILVAASAAISWNRRTRRLGAEPDRRD